MQGNDYGDLIERWKVELIRTRARRFRFRRDELPDLEQIIVLELLRVQNCPERKPTASERTFLTKVIDRQLMHVRRDRARQRRRMSYGERSLNAEPELAEKSAILPHQTVDSGLRLDIAEALAGLTAFERSICEGLMEGRSQAEIACSLGCHRSTICKQLDNVASKFRDWGLDAYVPRRRQEKRRQQPAENGQ